LTVYVDAGELGRAQLCGFIFMIKRYNKTKTEQKYEHKKIMSGYKTEAHLIKVDMLMAKT